MKAKKAPIESVAADSRTGTRVELVRLGPPAARPTCTFIEGEPTAMARELVRLLRDEVKVL
jgi:hypothetical protein